MICKSAFFLLLHTHLFPLKYSDYNAEIRVLEVIDAIPAKSHAVLQRIDWRPYIWNYSFLFFLMKVLLPDEDILLCRKARKIGIHRFVMLYNLEVVKF